MASGERTPSTAPQLTFDELKPLLESAEMRPDSLGAKNALQMAEPLAQMGAVALITGHQAEFEQWSAHVEFFGVAAETAFSSSRVYTKGVTTRDAYGVAHGHEPSVANFQQYLAGAPRERTRTLRTLVTILAEEDRSPETWIDGVTVNPTHRAIMNRIYFSGRRAVTGVQGRPFHPRLDAHQGMQASARTAALGELYDSTLLGMGADLLLVADEEYLPELIEKLVMAAQSSVDPDRMTDTYTSFLDVTLTALSNPALCKDDRQYVIEELYRVHDVAFQSGVSENTPKVSDTPAPAELEAVLGLEMHRALIQKDSHDSNVAQDSVVKAAQAAIANKQPEIAQALMQKIDDAVSWGKLAQQYGDWAGDVNDIQPDEFVSIVSPEHMLHFNIIHALQKRELSRLSGTIRDLARHNSPNGILPIVPYIRRAHRLDPATGRQITHDLARLATEQDEPIQTKEPLCTLQVMQGKAGASQEYYTYLRQNRDQFSPLSYLRSVVRYRMAHCSTM